jgi:hypothetical protein
MGPVNKNEFVFMQKKNMIYTVIYFHNVRFQSIASIVFLVAGPCSLVEVYRRFRGILSSMYG